MLIRITCTATLIITAIAPAMGQTAGIQSFQGRLKQNGTPVNGNVTLEFRVFDSAMNGNQVDVTGDGQVTAADIFTLSNVPVSNGLISTKFGPVHPSTFTGSPRWLEVTITSPAPVTTLPRLEMATALATAERLTIPGTGTNVLNIAPNGNIGIGIGASQFGPKLNVGDRVWLDSSSAGDISLWNSTGSSRIARLHAQGLSETGRLEINRPDGGFGIIANADDGAGYPEIQLSGAGNKTTVHLRGLNDLSSGGQLILFKDGGTQGANSRCTLSAEAGGHLTLQNDSNDTTLDARGDGSTGGAKLAMYNGQLPSFQETITLNANDGSGSGSIYLSANAPPTPNVKIKLEAKALNSSPEIRMVQGGSQVETLILRSRSTFNGNSTNGGELMLTDGSGAEVVRIAGVGIGGAPTQGRGSFQLKQANGDETVTMDATGSGEGAGGFLSIANGQGASNRSTINLIGRYDDGVNSRNGGRVQVANNGGTVMVEIFGDDPNVANNDAGLIRVTGTVCATTLKGTVVAAGSCDIAESFDLSDADKIQRGMVLVMDNHRTGHLTLGARAYDKKVAGIVSGAGGLRPGVVLGGNKDKSQSETALPQDDLVIALSGRVYCFVDATKCAIEVGDLLTTADTPGYAMKAVDSSRAFGAVLGKAMEPLAKGKKELILVLVALQ